MIRVRYTSLRLIPLSSVAASVVGLLVVFGLFALGPSVAEAQDYETTRIADGVCVRHVIDVEDEAAA